MQGKQARYRPSCAPHAFAKKAFLASGMLASRRFLRPRARPLSPWVSMQALDMIPWFSGSGAHTLAASSASLLADSIYSARLFDKDIWVNVMFGVRVALCLGVALFLLGEVSAWRMNVHVRERTKKRIALVLTVLAFATYFDF